MGDKTGISWCNHTFNPWIGCTKISDGCKFCYACRDNEKYKWTDGWGKDVPRHRTSKTNWEKPLLWAKNAVRDGVRRHVFCASLADVFDDEVTQEWREDLWKVIEETLIINATHNITDTGLEWLILTKRPKNISSMLPVSWIEKSPKGIRIGVTVENQDYMERIEDLFDAWNGANFVSYEPAIGILDLKGWLYKNGLWEHGQQRVDWVICGCESQGRPMDINWARFIRDQCGTVGVPFFLKQMVIDDKLVKMPLLDGKIWSEFPV
jgi:protein gp37